jgi:predicted dinucleotide-binding enzyme
VVKALNTVNCAVMVDPSRVPGRHDLFVAGNDAEAKQTVVALLGTFGWPADSVRDLGDITGARATEMYLPLWLRLMSTFGTADFNIRVTGL